MQSYQAQGDLAIDDFSCKLDIGTFVMSTTWRIDSSPKAACNAQAKSCWATQTEVWELEEAIKLLSHAATHLPHQHALLPRLTSEMECLQLYSRALALPGPAKELKCDLAALEILKRALPCSAVHSFHAPSRAGTDYQSYQMPMHAHHHLKSMSTARRWQAIHALYMDDPSLLVRRLLRAEASLVAAEVAMRRPILAEVACDVRHAMAMCSRAHEKSRHCGHLVSMLAGGG